MAFLVLETIRDGIRTCIDAETVPHEQHQYIDWENLDMTTETVYYPALVIPTTSLPNGVYLDLIVFDGEIRLTDCEAVCGEYYQRPDGFTDLGSVDYTTPGWEERLSTLLASFGVAFEG